MITLDATSPPPLPAEYHDLTARLEEAGGRYRLSQILLGLAKFSIVMAGVILGVLFLAGSYKLPAWANLMLAGGMGGAVVGGFAAFLYRPMFRKASYAEIARVVEQQGKGLDNTLINAVLLAQELETGRPAGGAGGSAAWIPHLLREVSGTTASIAFERFIPWKRTRKAGMAAAVVLVAAAVWVGAARPTFTHGVAVLMSPLRFVPREGGVRIVEVLPGNDTVLVGQDVDFSVRIERQHAGEKLPDAILTIEYAGGNRLAFPMNALGASGEQFVRSGVVAAEEMHYVVSVGETQSERYSIHVMPQIHLVKYALQVTPPAYMDGVTLTRELAEKDLTGGGLAGKGSIDAPLGSTVELTVTPDAPVKEILVDVAGGSPQTLKVSADGKSYSVRIHLVKSMQYVLRLNDGNHRTLKTFPQEEGGTFEIRATPDLPPTVTVNEPGRDVDAKPGEKVALEAQAADDHGLTQLRLEIAKNQEKEFRNVKTWRLGPDPQGKPATSALVRQVLELPASDFKMGDMVRYRFVAEDNRELREIDAADGGGGPQAAAGQIFTISFNDTAAVAQKSSHAWDELRGKLSGILEKQIALRGRASGLTAGMEAVAMRSVTTPIEEGQKEIRSDLATLAKDFPFEPSMKLVQKSLQVLVVEDAASAIERGQDILLLSDNKGLPALAVKLRQHQNRIIDVLQTLLAIAAANQERTAKGVDHEGGDLPSAADAWKKLEEQLKDFEKEQKAVIDATASLAKKPKGEFDSQDQRKLEELAAIEDKWEKYLNERLADMSKLAEQNAANAALLEEMVQMKVELATAKDALEQKATEIATPLEENGLENAKELTSHIERWLQQQPDRTAWQMEDAVTQNDPQMAELPRQLQDMVGELMDKEEDLTQEMESLGSKFADSMDKGAGWDAMDGPISNMTAQGVTGNEMPKDMEIQGRSGEGREGRASGEMVGSVAEGKEGRRTPTRLTPEPFSNGQVDDKSKLPEGGATGGGKKGGLGSDGLEGPVPADDPNTGQRLAGQQSAIRNEAERLALQMHAAGYDNFKLIEANAYLKKSEDALRANQYHTALYYQDQAVQSLNTGKVLAAGQVHVVADSSPGADEKKQKEMESALNGPMPRGYADPVKAYFEKLAGQ